MRTSRTRRLLLRLARSRCANHLEQPTGFCHLCFQAVLSEHLAILDPSLKMDEVAERVENWLAAAEPWRKDVNART